MSKGDRNRTANFKCYRESPLWNKQISTNSTLKYKVSFTVRVDDNDIANTWHIDYEVNELVISERIKEATERIIKQVNSREETQLKILSYSDIEMTKV